MKLIVGRVMFEYLEDQVQFPTENGYRTAGIAIEKPSSYINLYVTIPIVVPSVEGAVIQCVI
jgi:hypothetical protein